MTHNIPAPANPGGSADATVYDTGAVAAKTDVRQRHRIVVAAYVDQAATFKHKWAAPGSSNLRTMNGGGAGETITASTPFVRDVLLLPGRNQLIITTGTIPTVWEIGAELLTDSAMVI
jgi:hypothetical protein